MSNCQIVPVDVHIPIIQCLKCDTKYYLVPEFITTGTTMTLAAQFFVASVYHASKDGWRKIAKKYCPEKYGISHTTLYRGYHALGEKLSNIQEQSEFWGIINQSVATGEELTSSTYENMNCKNIVNSIPQKAIKESQKHHEINIIKKLLLLILSIEEGLQTYLKNLWKLTEILISQPGVKSKKETRGRPKITNTS